MDMEWNAEVCCCRSGEMGVVVIARFLCCSDGCMWRGTVWGVVVIDVALWAGRRVVLWRLACC